MRFVLILLLSWWFCSLGIVVGVDLGEIAATPDNVGVKIEHFPGEILINEVSFKDVESDWVELFVVDDGNDGDGANLKGFSLVDDRAFKTIESDFWVNSGDYLVLKFQLSEDDEFPFLYSSKKGLVGTTEQVVLYDSGGEIVDAVCWASDDPTVSEKGDFEQLIYSGQWDGEDFADCVLSADIKAGMVIGRLNFGDNDRAEDWQVVSPTPGGINVLGEIEEEVVVKKKTVMGKSSTKSKKYLNGDLSEKIVISEFLPNPTGTDKSNEWIELYNGSDVDVNLGNWEIVYVNEKSEKFFVLPDKIVVDAGSAYLIKDELGLALGNSGGTLKLLDFNGSEIFQVEYEGAPEGQAYSRIEIEVNGVNEEKWQWSSEFNPGEKNVELESLIGIVEVGPSENDNYHFVMKADGVLVEVFYLESVLPYSLGQVMLKENVGLEVLGYKSDRGFELRSLVKVEDVGGETTSNVSEWFQLVVWSLFGVLVVVVLIKFRWLEKFRSICRWRE